MSEAYPAGLTPDQLPPSVFLEYLVSLRVKERYSNHPLRDSMQVKGAIKNNTVRTYGRAAKVFLNWCYQNRLCSQRLTEHVRMPKPDPEQILPLSATEAEAMDAAFDPHIPNDLRNLCILHLMLDAGLRSCEVIRLQAADVVFSSGVLVVWVCQIWSLMACPGCCPGLIRATVRASLLVSHLKDPQSCISEMEPLELG